MGATLNTSQAVKQANMSAEAENRKKKVAKLGAKAGPKAGKGKAAKGGISSAPSKANQQGGGQGQGGQGQGVGGQKEEVVACASEECLLKEVR